ncbi:hypothetical protein PARA125_000641 [Parachlamydia sp. AcF125]|nr:hypothetical protein [Parachlamydia sp. AcF125]
MLLILRIKGCEQLMPVKTQGTSEGNRALGFTIAWLAVERKLGAHGDPAISHKARGRAKEARNLSFTNNLC